MEGFAGPLIQQQVEVEIHPFLERQQVADVPTPALVGPGQNQVPRRALAAGAEPLPPEPVQAEPAVKLARLHYKPF